MKTEIKTVPAISSVAKITVKVYDAHDLMREVDRIVNQYGEDYTYREHFTECLNFGTSEVTDKKTEVPVDTSKTGQCLIGRVFAAFGLTYEDCGNADVLTTVSTYINQRRPDVQFTGQFLIVARAGQAAQDGGTTWGEARSIMNATKEAINWLDVPALYEAYVK